MVLRCNPCKSKQLYIRTSSSLWLSLCLLETAATSVILSFLCIGLNERSGKTSFSVQKPSECWSHRLYHPCKPSTSAICQQNQCSRVIIERLWGFTHMLTMCICVEKPLLWHGGSLTQSGFFFWTGDSHCIPLLGLWGLPLQIPLCVYTAAVQYGVFLICSIKHIVYKSVCLLGFFQGSNYQVKYHSKNYFVYSCILMYEWEN